MVFVYSYTVIWCGVFTEACLMFSVFDWAILSFRFHSSAHPLLPFALLTVLMTPSGLTLTYFLRPLPIINPQDQIPLHPQQRFLIGRFVFHFDHSVSLYLLYYLLL